MFYTRFNGQKCRILYADMDGMLIRLPDGSEKFKLYSELDDTP